MTDRKVIQFKDFMEFLEKPLPVMAKPENRTPTPCVDINQDTSWSKIASIAEKVAAKEDPSIWSGSEDFDSVEEYAAYAYHLGRLDALRGVTINLKVEDGKINVDMYQTELGLDINAFTNLVYWEDEYGGQMYLSNVERLESIRKLVFEREEYGQDD